MMEAIVGLVTGVIASMGLGGGFVLMIWLTTFTGVEQRAAQGVNLLFFLPIALLSLVFHLKGGLINKQLVKQYILGGIVGAVIGTVASAIIPTELLRTLFTMFLLAFGIRELFTPTKQINPETSPQNKKPL